MDQSGVDILRLASGWISIHIRVVKLGVDVFKHVAQTGTRPGAHAQIDMIDIPHRVKPQHGWIDPTVNWNVRRTLCGWLANCRRTAGIAPRLSDAFRGSRLLSRNWDGSHQEKSCQHSCALDNRSNGHMSVHVHTHLSYSPMPDSSMNEPQEDCAFR